MSENAKRILYLFQFRGILTLEEVKRGSPHWAQAVTWLVNRGYLERLPDWRYQITNNGGACLATMEADLDAFLESQTPRLAD